MVDAASASWAAAAGGAAAAAPDPRALSLGKGAIVERHGGDEFHR